MPSSNAIVSEIKLSGSNQNWGLIEFRNGTYSKVAAGSVIVSSNILYSSLFGEFDLSSIPADAHVEELEIEFKTTGYTNVNNFARIVPLSIRPSASTPSQLATAFLSSKYYTYSFPTGKTGERTVGTLKRKWLNPDIDDILMDLQIAITNSQKWFALGLKWVNSSISGSSIDIDTTYGFVMRVTWSANPDLIHQPDFSSTYTQRLNVMNSVDITTIEDLNVSMTVTQVPQSKKDDYVKFDITNLPMGHAETELKIYKYNNTKPQPSYDPYITIAFPVVNSNPQVIEALSNRFKMTLPYAQNFLARFRIKYSNDWTIWSGTSNFTTFANKTLQSSKVISKSPAKITTSKETTTQLSYETFQDVEIPYPAGFKVFGHGKNVTGGTGGTVYYVTNLDDDFTNPPVGSLRQVLNDLVNVSGPKIVKFSVGGEIRLQNTLNAGPFKDITIDGSTAGTDGVLITGTQFSIRGNNMVVRYIRSRSNVPDDMIITPYETRNGLCPYGYAYARQGPGGQRTFITIDSSNVVVDHCSFGRGSDELLSIYHHDPSVDVQNVTVQWCLVGDSNEGGLYPLPYGLSVGFGKLFVSRAKSTPSDTVNNTIKQCNLDGTSPSTIVDNNDNLGTPFCIVTDEARKKIYWTDSTMINGSLRGTIRKSDVDGNNVETIITAAASDSGISVDTASLFGMALDSAAGKIYWLEWGNRKIKRANLDGTGIETIVRNIDAGYGLNLTLSPTKIYYVDRALKNDPVNNIRINDFIIREADKNTINQISSTVPNLNITGMRVPQSLVYNNSDRKLYWTDAMGRCVSRANVDGTGKQNIVSDVEYPFGLAIDESSGKLYFSDNSTNMLKQCNVDGTAITTIMTGVKGTYTGTGKGGLQGGNGSKPTDTITYCFNLISNNSGRNFDFGYPMRADFYNNVIANFKTGIEISKYQNTSPYLNIMNNYFIHQYNTPLEHNKPVQITWNSLVDNGTLYMQGNFDDIYSGAEDQSKLLTNNFQADPHVTLKTEPYPTDAELLPIYTVYSQVINNAGCRLPKLDSVDNNTIKNTIAKKATCLGCCDCTIYSPP